MHLDVHHPSRQQLEYSMQRAMRAAVYVAFFFSLSPPIGQAPASLDVDTVTSDAGFAR